MNKNIKISIITSLYRGEKYIEDFFENFLEVENLEELELIIIHNDPTIIEKNIIKKYQLKIKNIFIIECNRENVYKSWNRGIKVSHGEYIAMWNIDDRRIKNSLKNQAIILDNDKTIGIVTGDYYKILRYGNKDGILKEDNIILNKFNKIFKFNNGCFLMWRKVIHDKIGYFDEQFKVGGDWEFWMRVTAQYKVYKCDTILGYYLRESETGISKSKKYEKDIENAVIKIRYYRFFLINIYKLLLKHNYNRIDIYKIKNYDNYIDFNFRKSFPYFSISLSLLLFWIPSLKRGLVELKYRLLS